MAGLKLTDEQKAKVAGWAAEGADLNGIQDRLKSELGVTLTFMETRFLISDLGVTLQSKTKDEEEDVDEEPPDALDALGTDVPNRATGPSDPAGTPPAGDSSGVKVTVDEITLPGSMASGKVTFSDGTKASWSLDQLGRLGLSGVDRTYQPPETDVIAFQRELQRALRGM